jgi:pyrimidine deaminase RibD-like protein
VQVQWTKRGFILNDRDTEFIKLAIAEAQKCQPEDERIHPRVGVVVVKERTILAASHRGEREPGNHAEFTALEAKLANLSLVGATVYTTLEPCTTRNHPKVPCAQRLLERKIDRVVIGLLDPNPEIQGNGIRVLRAANIAVELFPRDFAAQVEEMNRDFIRQHSKEKPEQAMWVVDGEHRAEGSGEITALDIEGSAPVRLMPGTRATAQGEGNVTGTRIRTRIGGKE